MRLGYDRRRIAYHERRPDIGLPLRLWETIAHEVAEQAEDRFITLRTLDVDTHAAAAIHHARIERRIHAGQVAGKLDGAEAGEAERLARRETEHQRGAPIPGRGGGTAAHRLDGLADLGGAELELSTGRFRARANHGPPRVPHAHGSRDRDR